MILQEYSYGTKIFSLREVLYNQFWADFLHVHILGVNMSFLDFGIKMSFPDPGSNMSCPGPWYQYIVLRSLMSKCHAQVLAVSILYSGSWSQYLLLKSLLFSMSIPGPCCQYVIPWSLVSIYPIQVFVVSMSFLGPSCQYVIPSSLMLKYYTQVNQQSFPTSNRKPVKNPHFSWFA